MAHKPTDADTGIVRTDMYCTECHKNFVAEIDFDIDGDHIIVCPYCAHEHCRKVENGKITEVRWNTKNHDPKAIYARVWKHDSLKMKTSTACSFIREKWLSFGANT